MKIAISSMGDSLASKADPRFGRAPYFIFVDEDDLGAPQVYAIRNDAADTAMGAGTEAAQQVINEGATGVISGAVGPNAFGVFEKMGVDVYRIQGDMTVERAYQKYRSGLLQKVVIKRL